MIYPQNTFSPVVGAMLALERAIPVQPAAVRARALVRARAAVVAGAGSLAAPAARAIPRRWTGGLALACIACAGVGIAAYDLGARANLGVRVQPDMPAVFKLASSRERSPPVSPAVDSYIDAIADMPPVEVEARVAKATAGASPRWSSSTDAVRDELHLLKGARAAVAGEDYAAALFRLDEHARRFRAGRLTEEREALRIKALAGLGRTDEARHAAIAFRARFPHSVLVRPSRHIAESER